MDDGAKSASPLPTEPRGGVRAARAVLPERYLDLGLIGLGGMGEVRRVRDTQLGRVVAMKIVGWRVVGDGRSEERFQAEARALAALEHPNIVPLYDFGRLRDGRAWFTMRVVRGETLDVPVRRAHAGGDPASIRRLVSLFEQVCQAIAFAHEAGVLHRDLKPGNIMVGPFGEVQVLDWGLVRGEAVGAVPNDAHTLQGAALGTVAYMPPEQARGRVEEHGPWSDVFALGGVLRFILTGEAPRPEHTPVQGALRPLAPVSRTGSAPAFLLDLVDWSMRWDPALRLPNAVTFANEVRTWLDGERLRADALEAFAQVGPLQRRTAELRAEAVALERRADAALAGVLPHEGERAKRAGWRLEDLAQLAARQAILCEAEIERTLHAALRFDSSLTVATEGLADLYRARMERAERRGDVEAAALIEAQLRGLGHHLDWLDGGGELSLQTEPPGATVWSVPWTLDGRRLIEGSPRVELGRTPLARVPIGAGRQLLVVEKVGCRAMRIPVRVRRQEHVDSVRSERGPVVHRLPAEELSDEWVSVPAGWCEVGGDASAPDALAARRVWIDAFLIGRNPVTHRAYLDTLNAMVEAGDVALAEQLQPGHGRDGSGAVFEREGDRFVVGAASPALDTPVCLVSWEDARQYAAWHSRRRGYTCRLPMSLEWEKAARGGDGRLWPWGDHFDASWTSCAGSFADAPHAVAVQDLPLDRSPYGVLGMAGNVRDWCLDLYSRMGATEHLGTVEVATVRSADSSVRVVRGGTWAANPAQCRSASRYGAPPGQRYLTVGFRLASSWPWVPTSS